MVAKNVPEVQMHEGGGGRLHPTRVFLMTPTNSIKGIRPGFVSVLRLCETNLILRFLFYFLETYL